MSNDEFENDVHPAELEKEPAPEKPSLSELWESNPMVKVAAIVLGLAVSVGSYVIFSKGPDANKAMVHVGDMAEVKQVPGQKEVDPEYRRRLEEENKKGAEAAAQTGISALPVPIGVSKGGLEMPQMPEKPKTDVLAEWRRATEMHKALPETKEAPPPPEVVPMVQQIRPQQVVHRDPNDAKKLAEQMRTIIAAHAPTESKVLNITKKDSAYVEMMKEEEQDKASGLSKVETSAGSGTAAASGTGGDTSNQKPERAIVPAGQIAYAQLVNELNSDVPGPVLAQVLSGPFAGGRAIGKIDVKDEYMVLTFTTVVKDAVSYKINAVAMDENTTLTGQATDVDHHYFTRIILPAAAKFVEGYGSSVSQTGTTTSQTSGGGQSQSTPKPDAKENIYKGVEEASKQVSDMLSKQAQTTVVTVKIAKGTTMGLLFIDTVTNKDAVK